MNERILLCVYCLMSYTLKKIQLKLQTRQRTVCNSNKLVRQHLYRVVRWERFKGGKNTVKGRLTSEHHPDIETAISSAFSNM
jgi:hypothetical protein